MVSKHDLQSPIGLVAGSGDFPRQVAVRARAAGLRVVAVAHRGETDPGLEAEVDECLWVRVGQLGKVISFLRSHSVRHAAFAGGIARVKLFQGARPDWRGAALLARLRSVRDDVLLRGVAEELERDGISVFGAEVLLDEVLPKVGALTKRSLSADERRNALIGWEVAKSVGALDIGQTVITAGGLVVAVEAVEGTDRAIERAHELAGENLVVVKVSKPQQDARLDLPTIGPKSIEVMARCGVSALVIEAGKTIVLDPDRVVREADRADIAIEAFETL